MPKIVPKRFQTCFDCNLGQFFRKVFAQFSMEGQVFENFQKYQKRFKFPKMPKIVPKSIQTCFGRVWGKLSENFCPVFHGMSSLQKFSKKNIFKVPKMPKIVPESIQTCFERVLGQIFRKIFAQFSVECRVFENFQKFFFQNSKNAQKCSQKNPNVF